MSGNVYVKDGSFMYKYFELTYDAYKLMAECKSRGNEQKARMYEIAYNSNLRAIDTLNLLQEFNAFVEKKMTA